MVDGEKKCRRCLAVKPITAELWYFDKKTGRIIPRCKACHAEVAAARYVRDREKILVRTADYQKANKHRQKYYHERYVTKDPEGYKARRRAVAAKRRETVSGNLSNRMQAAVWRVLKGAGVRKMSRMFQIVGWTIDELKAHLEERFEEGMSWENMGEWHIDHIMPISVMHITSEQCEEFKSVWRLKNLAPLWATDNIQKKDNITWRLPASYKNPKLRSMYLTPVVDNVAFFNIDTKALKDMGYEAIAFGSATESKDSIANGSFIRL